MRIHTDTLTVQDLTDAAVRAGCRVESATHHRSTARGHAFEFVISGHGRNGGAYGSVPYAVGSWDDYGIILAELFRRDPCAIIGTPGRPTYDGTTDFHQETAYRYESLSPADAHHNHKRDHSAGRDAEWVTESGHRLVKCRKCPAYV